MGAVVFGGALSSPKAVEVTSVIRYEGYYKVIISTDHSCSDLHCSLEVSSRETETRNIPLLQGKMLTIMIFLNDISEVCMSACTCFSPLTHN